MIRTLAKLKNPLWICFTLTLLSACGHDKAQNKKPVPVVTAGKVMRKDIPVYLDGLGTVQAYNTVTVHSQVDGQLMEVLFHEGQDIKQGDVLAKIDPRTFKAALDQAVANKAKDQAVLTNAQLDLKRYLTLGDTISGQTVDTQRATVKQDQAAAEADQAAIDNAKAELGYTTITAPINGRTGLRQVDIGNIVHSSDTNGLVVLTQLQPIAVIFSLPQQQLLPINEQINLQQKLKILAVDTSGQTIDTGELELVDNQIDQTTGTIKLKSIFPNEKRLLWPGGFVNVRLLLKTLNNAVVVPNTAIQSGPQSAYVFLVQPDDTVKIHNVKIGVVEGLETVVTDGLNGDEQIITDGAAKLQDGSKVQIAGKEKPAEQDGKENNDSEHKDENSHRHRNK